MQALKPTNLRAEPATEAADRLHSAAIHLLRRLRVRDRESGVGPAQLSALSVLVFGGPASLAELAAAEQVRPPTMSRIVAALLRAGMVRRKTDRRDRRAVVIKATPRGVRIMQQGRRRRVEALAVALRGLRPGEIERLRKSTEMIEQLIRRL